MRAFMSIAVVLAFLPMLYAEISAESQVIGNANAVKENFIEGIAFGEARYEMEDGFLIVLGEGIRGGLPEESICMDLQQWSLLLPESELHIGYVDSAGNPLARMPLLAECAAFLGKGEDRIDINEKPMSELPAIMVDLAMEYSGHALAFTGRRMVGGKRVTAIIREGEVLARADIP